MADKYRVVSSYEDVEFLGGSATQDVIVTGIRTIPSGIYVEARTPKATFDKIGPAAVNVAANAWATLFEELVRNSNVAAVSWGQRSAGGQLEDVAVFTVVSDSGNSSAQLTVPIAKISPQGVVPGLSHLAKQLTETEGL